MAEGTTVGKNPEEIRQQIDGARAALDEKLQTVESNVKETVQAAKEKLSPAHYVESNPWACFGAAVGVGFLLGQLTVGSSHSRSNHSGFSARFRGLGSLGENSVHSNGTNGNGHTNGAGGGALAGIASSGLMMAATKFFDKEIRDLRNYAIGQAMSVAREVVKGAVSPDMAPRVGEVFDRATRYMGAKPASSSASAPSATA